MVISSLISSDSTVMVKIVAGGAFPKSSGWVVLTVSPSLMLSKVTIWEEGLAVPAGISKPETDDVSSGAVICASGFTDSWPEGRFLKSYVCPKTMVGIGLALAGKTWAEAIPSGPA